MVIAETAYLLDRQQLGARAETALYRSITTGVLAVQSLGSAVVVRGGRSDSQ